MKDDRCFIEGTGRLLMHEMLVGHDEQGGVVPRRRELFLPGQLRFLPASLAVQVKALHPVMQLGGIRCLHGARALGPSAREWFMLKGPYDQVMRGEFAERRQCPHASTSFAQCAVFKRLRDEIVKTP
jgi:hypothetical protein